MEQIKKLRDLTGAGISECKIALDEANGDLQLAIDILRKKGAAKAAKRSDRQASQGLIKIAINDERTKGYLIKINSETDFVARNEQFQKLAQEILEALIKNEPADLSALKSCRLSDGQTIEESVVNLSGVIGEKIELSQSVILTGTMVADYLHAGGQIGVLVSFDKVIDQTLARDIAMQIAASNPKYIYLTDVDQNDLEREKEIYRAQLATEGKPEQMIEKILSGKISKYFEEVCLTKQEFIKDESKKIEDLLGEVKILSFIRSTL